MACASTHQTVANIGTVAKLALTVFLQEHKLAT